MKIVLQRVKNAQVKVDEKSVGKIEKGLLIFLGIGKNDDEKITDKFVKKICNLRIFEDENKKMNKSVKDINGDILIISQFTLYANCKKGRRPSFLDAAKPEISKPLYEYFNKALENAGVHTETGIFGAMMKVSLINDGPTTIILDSKEII